MATCSVSRQTHVQPLRELCLRASGTQIQKSQQPLQICNSALPIQAQTTTCLLEQMFHLTLHAWGSHTTPSFEVLLGFCKLLPAAVSTLDLHRTHTCSITNAKGSHRNSTDLCCLWIFVFLPQLFAQYGRGCNLHNLQILRTLFPRQLPICEELPT